MENVCVWEVARGKLINCTGQITCFLRNDKRINDWFITKLKMWTAIKNENRNCLFHYNQSSCQILDKCFELRDRMAINL